MANWYENGLIQIKEQIASETKVDIEDVEKVYEALRHIDLIDYDLEKEVIRDISGEDHE